MVRNDFSNGLVVERRSRDPILPVLEPEVLDPSTVRYWSRSSLECVGSQHAKARKLLMYDSIQYLGESQFVCLPLNTDKEVVFAGRTFVKVPYGKTYNHKKEPFTLWREGVDSWRCNCQFNTTTGNMCSHVLALMWAFKMKKFGGIA